MDEDDDSAALAHQMELEQRQQEEEQAAMNRCRRLTAELRAGNRQFDEDMQQLRTRINSLQEYAND